ncbi:MAG: hypothetical protein U5K43_13805 [Halofilum sp. (in: g-proteobacteria)]|nr:hypothetical protein [Halofilum sp. (in: g-proteobacteria)]
MSTGARRLAIAILLICISALFTQGLVYGMMSMRPVWYGIGTPLYYMYGSVLTGVALSLLFINITHGFRQQGSMGQAKRHVMRDQLPMIFLVALIGYAFVLAAKITTGLWSPTAGVQIVYQHMVGSPLFWFELLAGLVVPVALMMPRRTRAQPCGAVRSPPFSQ